MLNTKCLLMTLLIWCSLAFLFFIYTTEKQNSEDLTMPMLDRLLVMAQQNCVYTSNLVETFIQTKKISHLDYTIDVSDAFTKPKALQEYIFFMNTQQPIYNEELHNSAPNFNVVIVVQVHDRLVYLKELIKSLSETPEIDKALLIFSHDVYDAKIRDAIQTINFTKVMQIFYPFSIQTHPDEFPGPDAQDCQPKTTLTEALKVECKNIHYKDTYGHFRDAAAAQIKHHWWWKINFVFGKIRTLMDYHGLVLFLEEDHYVAPDFIHCLKLMEKHAKESCEQCWFFALGLNNRQLGVAPKNQVVVQKNMENLGLALNRSTWYEISRRSDVFCKFDDYNWDWTLRYMIMEVIKPQPLTMVMGAQRVAHIGLCGAHSQGKSCDPTRVIAKFRKNQDLFPESLTTSRCPSAKVTCECVGIISTGSLVYGNAIVIFAAGCVVWERGTTVALVAGALVATPEARGGPLFLLIRAAYSHFVALGPMYGNPGAVQVAALLSYLQLHATQVGIVRALPTALLVLHTLHCLQPNTRQSREKKNWYLS